MKPGSISVVILCRNHEQYVRACLESVFAADQECELVFVDNGSKDRSVAVAQEKLRGAPPHVKWKVVPLTPEQPMCRFFNIAVRESSGEFVKPIASDDKLGPNFFSGFRYVRDSSEATVGVWLAGSVFIDAEDRVIRQHYQRALFGSPGDGPTAELEERHLFDSRNVPLCTTASMIYRRRVFDEVGGYDERFRYEDRPFQFNVMKRGWSVAVHPYNNTYYRVHDGGISANAAWMAEARVPILFDHTLRADWRNKPFAFYQLARNVRVVAMNRWRKWRATRT